MISLNLLKRPSSPIPQSRRPLTCIVARPAFVRTALVRIRIYVLLSERNKSFGIFQFITRFTLPPAYVELAEPGDWLRPVAHPHLLPGVLGHRGRLARACGTHHQHTFPKGNTLYFASQLINITSSNTKFRYLRHTHIIYSHTKLKSSR